MLFDGAEFGHLAEPGSDEEWDFIGIPGILEPEQVSELLRSRQTRQARRSAGRPISDDVPPPLHRTLSEQRQLLNRLVSIRARNTGQTHAYVHAEVRRVNGGPEVARASVTQLQKRIDWLRARIGQ
ncbi:hypothetical protein GCM10025881_39580 [Pseudolysinimonas kribbensis]|uniref:Uncharacterized protein n=1 Tax=Pseudolysinimonas kribbensis TaxID=433641 RepID=A0ABQ6K0E0_9MICO|nr:hypothetical protein GCM10025881_00500 [Pseudolysinimonas kribbensis]GMA97134.1 hypothetical protein GCM10025881_39580 [Pseudolysinimonas kribbensis]